jgi:hypothetical protein
MQTTAAHGFAVVERTLEALLLYLEPVPRYHPCLVFRQLSLTGPDAQHNKVSERASRPHALVA